MRVSKPVLTGYHQMQFKRLAAVVFDNFLVTLYFFKILCLSQADGITKATSGYIINLIASDLQYFINPLYCIFALLQTLFELCSISFLMFYLFGWKPLSGVVFLVLLSLYYGVMGKVCGKLRSKISEVADTRINIMNSIVYGIRAVKMYAWEQPFKERVQRIRRYMIY